MRSAFWVLVVVFSGCALLGGYFSGRAAAPPLVFETPAPDPGVTGVLQQNETADDDFAGDAAVVADAPGGEIDKDSRLSFVLVDCGQSVPLESLFLRLGVPLALVVDPVEPAAHATAAQARQFGKMVFVQAALPLSAHDIRALQDEFPGIAGIAIRVDRQRIDNGVLRALRDAGLRLFDEYGGYRSVQKRAVAAGVRYLRRTITIDDDLEPSYVAYMLDEAVRLGRGSGAVVMARPFPGTLHALEAVLSRAPRDGIRIVRLP